MIGQIMDTIEHLSDPVNIQGKDGVGLQMSRACDPYLEYTTKPTRVSWSIMSSILPSIYVTHTWSIRTALSLLFVLKPTFIKHLCWAPCSGGFIKHLLSIKPEQYWRRVPLTPCLPLL